MKQAYLLTAAGALAALAAATPASAAPSAASVYEAGRCIVDSDRRIAASLLRNLPLDSRPADLSGLRGGRASGCNPGPGVPAMVMRGALAQELFLRDFRSFGVEPRNPDRLVNLNLPVQTYGAVGSSAPGDLYRWSDCVVRNDTANTERLLRSRVGSSEEANAISGLQSYMTACIAADSQLSVRSSELRSVIAQSAYYSMYRYWLGDLRTARSER